MSEEYEVVRIKNLAVAGERGGDESSRDILECGVVLFQ